jgi:membrane-associated phospholipid phosphatase
MAPEVKQSRRLGKRGGWILLVFTGVYIPLLGLGALIEGLRDGEGFTFDLPVLQAMHSIGNAHLDHMALTITALGYGWGVIPADALLVFGLVVAGRLRDMIFAGISILGSFALNAAVKHSIERSRPSLWEPLAHEASSSFPSGHAMASMTLAWVAVLLCWSQRSQPGWKMRWPVALIAAPFVVLVGLSRIYLGVHYPSDILAGWTAASIWVVSVYALMFHKS